ncbi:MAG: protein-L-isoaspartate(D-aspartate) O-methyltransferase [Planctomycetes bacterium]|nr:protein-L-isoaspartate(D-aspartate) O-methyltransferase [Planctomycetota bacterium]
MVTTQLIGRDITHEGVLQAMARVPRHEFAGDVPLGVAYGDHPIPIGFGQTISQPYIVALMTQLALPQPRSRVLDVGTGRGYQAAVLSELVGHVWSLEIVPELAESAAERLRRLGYLNVDVLCRDAAAGLPTEAPFDVIICAAAPRAVPESLVDQLAPGGRFVLPVGVGQQSLLVVTKNADGSVKSETIGAVSFVPMTGEVAD